MQLLPHYTAEKSIFLIQRRREKKKIQLLMMILSPGYIDPLNCTTEISVSILDLFG